MRRAAKVDDNQREIVKKLRSIGCSVRSTAAIGKGFPDLVVGYRGINYLFEVKDGSKPPSARKLTSMQKEFALTWGGSVHVVNSFDEALAVLKNVKKAKP